MEENEVLIKVEGLSKKFCKDLKTSLRYGLQDLFLNIRGNKKERLLREKEFWALKDINFELRRGECLGLIGHNGAGKSTLLKILNGLIKPDSGKVTIKGRVGALIELGAGFNPILTGRENIFNNGAVLGLTRQEIEAKIDTIIDFAEVREFIDMPVQNYSSGMKVRLGFAVAAQMKPDVLLIDEVLAVGDMGFVLKCFKKIDSILPHTAIVFVSHNMPMVSRICKESLLMRKGEVAFHGSTGKSIELYYSFFQLNSQKVIFDSENIFLNEIKILCESGKIQWGEDLKVFLDFEVRGQIDLPLLRLIINDKEQRPVAIIEENLSSWNIEMVKNKLAFILIHEKLQLSKGIYSISLAVFKSFSNDPLLRINDVISFQVSHEIDVWTPFMLSTDKIINYNEYLNV